MNEKFAEYLKGTPDPNAEVTSDMYAVLSVHPDCELGSVVAAITSYPMREVEGASGWRIFCVVDNLAYEQVVRDMDVICGFDALLDDERADAAAEQLSAAYENYAIDDILDAFAALWCSDDGYGDIYSIATVLDAVATSAHRHGHKLTNAVEFLPDDTDDTDTIDAIMAATAVTQ